MRLSVHRTGHVLCVCVCMVVHTIFCKGVFIISMEENIFPQSLLLCMLLMQKPCSVLATKQRQQQVRELINPSIVVAKRKARLGQTVL